jgi:MFS family permease
MMTKLISSIKRFLKHPLFLTFYLPSLLASTGLGLRNTILPLYVGELSDAYGLVGLVVAGAGLGTLIADVPVGQVVQRIDKRIAMIAGLGVEAVTTLALVWVRSVWLALALQILGGISISVFVIARHAYITNAVSLEKRGRAISLFGGVLRVGLFIGPIIGGQIAAAFGLRLPFVAYAVLSLAAIVVLALAKDQFISADPDTVGAVENGRTSLAAALKGRAWVFSMASLGHILAMVTRAGQSLILPLWGADVLSLSPDQIGWAVSLSAAVSMTLFYPVGQIMDRIGRKAAIVPSFVLMGAGLAILPMVHEFPMFLLVAALLGLGHGMGSGAMMTLGSDLSPEKGRSAFLGAWRWIGDVGMSGGPMIVGFVADALALPNAVLVIALSGLVAGGVFGFLVPETLKKKRKLRTGEING